MANPLGQDKHNPINEEAVWSDFKSGGKSAFETIYRLYFKDLFRYGMTILSDEAFIKDAIQELFVDLWRYREKLSKPDKLKFYLIKSLRTKIYKHIDQAKRSNLNAVLFQKTEVQFLPSQEESIIASDESRMRSKKITLLVNDLPERQREAIMLIFFEAKTYEEAATLMSMSIQSVYTLIWKAVSSLRKKLQQH